MKTKLFIAGLSLLGLTCLCLPCINALASKPAASTAPQRYIFSRSTRQNSSSSLGITGVPAYVNFPDHSQKLGVYVTGTQPGGAWQSAGLRPGRVVLTVNNRVVDSPSAIDNAIGTSSGRFECSYVKMVDGLPHIVKSVLDASVTRLGMAPPVQADLSGDIPGMKKVVDNTPLSELESYMASLVNKDRAANGKSALCENSRLQALAKSYAEFLITHGAFSHTADGHDPYQRAVASGIKSGIAENLAFQPRGMKAEKDLVARAESNFMAEPPNQKNHRGNILWDEAQTVGVGMARDKDRLMMVQEFSNSNP